jgi:hypothetical protein
LISSFVLDRWIAVGVSVRDIHFLHHGRPAARTPPPSKTKATRASCGCAQMPAAWMRWASKPITHLAMLDMVVAMNEELKACVGADLDCFVEGRVPSY